MSASVDNDSARPVLTKDAKAEFQRFLRARGERVSSLNPRQALQCMVAFYRDLRVEDCDSASDGDMLLLQWGTYDWGHGKHFEFDITRQLIPHGGDDDQLWQLHLTVRFAPNDVLQALGAGSRQCHDLEQLQGFFEFATSSEAFLSVADRTDGIALLDYEIAG